MRKILVSMFSLALMLVVVLSVGCGGGGGGGGTSPVAPTTGGSLADLRGTVTYLGKAVPNASVFLLKPTDNTESLRMRASVLAQPKPDFSVLMADGSGYQTLANEKGEYLFSQVPVGTYTLTAQAGENTQISQSVILGAISSLDLALMPTGALSGKIVFGFTDPYTATQGGPVSGELFGLEGTPYISWTQSDGTITFNNIPVRATPYTIVPVYQNWLTFKNPPVTASPVAGTTTAFGTKEVILAQTTIKGVAKLPTGPISGIYVSSSRGGTTSTDSAGNYQFTNVSFGKVVLTYSYYSGEPYTAQQEVTVNTLATMTLPDVTLQPGSANQARVDVGTTGLAGSGYIYYEIWEDGGTSYEQSGNAYAGATYTYNLDPGTWYLKVYSTDYLLLNAAPGTTDLLASMTLAAGGNASFVARLQYNKADLTGTLTNFDANYPINSAYLYTNGSPRYISVSGANFSVTGITPGVHSLYFSGPGYRVSSTSVTLTAGANTRTVALTPIFPTVTGGTFTAPNLTVTGTRFDVSTSSIWLESGALSGGNQQVPAATRTATQMTYDTSSLPPGQYYAYARGQDLAMSTGFYTFTKPFTAGVAITSTDSDVSSSTFVLRWNSYPGTANYVVSQTGGPSYTVSNTTSSQLFTNLQPNTAYTFTIYATGYGIPDSTTTTTTFTTKKVYQTPVTLDTGIAYSGFFGSQTKNGAVFSVIQDSTVWKLVKLDLNTQVVTTATLTPPGTQSFQTFYVNTSPYNSDIYVVWAGGKGVTVQQFMFGTLSESTNLFTSTFPGAYGLARGARIITPADDAYALRILTWGEYGDVSPTFIASYSVVNTNLTGAVESPAPLTYVDPSNDDIMWTPVKGSDGAAYYAMVYRGSSQTKYDLYASDSTTLEDTAFLNGAYDITPSPLGGLVLCDGNRSYYMKPPSAFGGFSFSTSGANGLQVVVDDAGKFYFYQAGVSSTLQRYSSTGALLDASDFKDGLAPSFGKKCISYDSTTSQVLVAQKTDTGTLGFAAFNTAE